ncbi:alpha-L-fucosidase [Chryseolinea lacunae]|uniref:alpha-L-fucosidase n=1 Tax=Chryseolinea lacunae TaxID=2801331 RepID=A0ABS1L253_9BACT|nr:alpha-L-fucosidase [Chryseolinea lacunae]MBL0745801.1 alpha-L-fucosidase [Chryseolinea lacunae]
MKKKNHSTKMTTKLCVLNGALILAFFLPSLQLGAQDSIHKEKYLPTWKSLANHKIVPDWLRDGKFGLYFNWGVYSVPEKFSEWYPRQMYDVNDPAFQYHKETYGDQSKFGYHDFVPMFTGKNFDASHWAHLTKLSGAHFGGIVAEHHDGYSMWKSSINPWNSFDTGPHKDIAGLVKNEMTKLGIKFFVSFHHARNLQRNSSSENDGNYDSHFIYNPKWHTSSTDPRLRLLYGNITKNEFYYRWAEKLHEVVDRYSPDIIYFDSWLNLIPENYSQEFCAYYLNHANKTQQDVAIVYKQHDLPITIGINDIEKGGHAEVFNPFWMSDDVINFGSWSYTDSSRIKPVQMVLHSLIDIVSKNGALLLAVSPRADGSVPPEQERTLTQLGQWLHQNGEAIYNTRPWLIYGGGPTIAGVNEHGGFENTTTYTWHDYRYTFSKDGKSIYIIFLGKPPIGTRIKLRDFAPHRYPPPSSVKKVEELSTGTPAILETMDNAFFLTIPDCVSSDYATVFKFSLQ